MNYMNFSMEEFSCKIPGLVKRNIMESYKLKGFSSTTLQVILKWHVWTFIRSNGEHTTPVRQEPITIITIQSSEHLCGSEEKIAWEVFTLHWKEPCYSSSFTCNWSGTTEVQCWITFEKQISSARNNKEISVPSTISSFSYLESQTPCSAVPSQWKHGDSCFKVSCNTRKILKYRRWWALPTGTKYPSLLESTTWVFVSSLHRIF